MDFFPGLYKNPSFSRSGMILSVVKGLVVYASIWLSISSCSFCSRFPSCFIIMQDINSEAGTSMQGKVATMITFCCLLRSWWMFVLLAVLRFVGRAKQEKKYVLGQRKNIVKKTQKEDDQYAK